MKRLIIILASTTLFLSSASCTEDKTISEVENEAINEINKAQSELAEDTEDIREDSNGLFDVSAEEQREEIAELREETQQEINEIRQDAKLVKKDVYLAKLEERQASLDQRIDQIVNRVEKRTEKTPANTADMQKIMYLTAARAGLAKGIDYIESIDDDRWLAMRDPVSSAYEQVLRSLEGFQDPSLAH